jgi:hypothetical protein
MKVIIAGSRGFSNFKFMTEAMDKILSRQTEVEIISGTANGADKLGEAYAKMRNFNIIRMPADWTKYGKSAGYKRNVKMASIADAVVVFWDNQSKGSKHMIDIAKERNLPLRVIKY